MVKRLLVGSGSQPRQVFFLNKSSPRIFHFFVKLPLKVLQCYNDQHKEKFIKANDENNRSPITKKIERMKIKFA